MMTHCMMVIGPRATAFTPHSQSLALVEESIARISLLSRTFKGESNTDVSSLKAPLLLRDAALAAKVRDNFRNAVHALLEYGPSDIRGETDAAMLIFDTAVRANDGLLAPARPIFRTWETGISNHAPAWRVVEEFQQFAAKLSDRWRDTAKDPIGFAAWVERASNAHGHFITDGCGRIARSFSTATLARAGLAYPRFESRTEYFSLITRSADEWDQAYRARTSI